LARFRKLMIREAKRMIINKVLGDDVKFLGWKKVLVNRNWLIVKEQRNKLVITL